MNLNNYYWYFKSVIPPRICDDIVKYALSKEQTVARIGGYEDKKLSKQDIKNIQNYRKSDITWLDDTWIYKEVHPYIHEANKLAGWNFQWDFSEPCQFTKYKHNQYYDWHCDSMDKVYDEKHGDLQKGKIRKLSMTCQLTDGSEYEGGELEFDYRNYEPHMRDEEKHLKKTNEILSKGSIIVFPSFIWHRVKPVTKGTRYSLVMWSLGYPYK